MTAALAADLAANDRSYRWGLVSVVAWNDRRHELVRPLPEPERTQVLLFGSAR